jgi:hypothetical protein
VLNKGPLGNAVTTFGRSVEAIKAAEKAGISHAEQWSLFNWDCQSPTDPGDRLLDRDI